MITDQQAQTIIDSKATVVSTDGDKIGSAGTLYVDDDTGRPSWVTVKTGLFGTSETFVPLESATLAGETVTVPYSKDMVKDAPRVDADQHLDRDQEAELYRYYSLEYGTGAGTAGVGTAGVGTAGVGTAGVGTAGVGTAGYVADDAARRDTGDDDTLVRSEERVDVGTRKVESGKVRLRKYVVTENVTKTVPVTREEVRVEREPITDADRARGAGDLGEDVAEVTLHEEEVVTDRETVPVEKVHLDKDTVTDDVRVTEEVRKEKIDTETDRDRDTR